MFTNKKDDHSSRDESREIIKEGLVNYFSVCELEEPKWEKCRLVLVKSKNASLLEFYSPTDRSYPPKCGLFCFLINEVRQTKQLEMPEKPCTFVIRFSNLIEYIIETENYQDLMDWLRTIREQTVFANVDDDDMDVVDSESNFKNNVAFLMLENYPWYHRNITRYEATSLVLKGGEEWSGVFLIRQSETRHGECVLTFNFRGNAKNLRIVIKPEGRCILEKSCFPSIFNLLEHFRVNYMPMKNDRKLLLTDFIIFNGNTNHRKSIYGSSNIMDQTVKKFGGSVRLTTEELKSMILLQEK